MEVIKCGQAAILNQKPINSEIELPKQNPKSAYLVFQIVLGVSGK